MNEPNQWRGLTPAEYKRRLREEARAWTEEVLGDQRRKPPVSKKATISLDALRQDCLIVEDVYHLEPDDDITEDVITGAIGMIEDEAIREAIDMRFYDGMSLRQIAAAQNCSHTTAARRIERGLAEMREYLKASEASWLYGEDDDPHTYGEVEVPELVRARIKRAVRAARYAHEVEEAA